MRVSFRCAWADAGANQHCESVGNGVRSAEPCGKRRYSNTEKPGYWRRAHVNQRCEWSLRSCRLASRKLFPKRRSARLCDTNESLPNTDFGRSGRVQPAVAIEEWIGKRDCGSVAGIG